MNKKVLSELGETQKKLTDDLEATEEEIENHPRVKEWLKYILEPRPYFSPCLEKIEVTKENVLIEYWCQAGTEYDSIPIEVIESEEPIKDYYQRLENEKKEGAELLVKEKIKQSEKNRKMFEQLIEELSPEQIKEMLINSHNAKCDIN